jgi:hypothetical protein
MTAILLTQISACLHVPRDVRAELEPDGSPQNHFANEPAARQKSADESTSPE